MGGTYIHINWWGCSDVFRVAYSLWHARQHANNTQHAMQHAKIFFQIPRMLGRRASCGEGRVMGRPPQVEGGHMYILDEVRPDSGYGEYTRRRHLACLG